MLVGYKGNYKNHEYYYCIACYINTPVVFIDKKQIEDFEFDANKGIEYSIKRYIDKIDNQNNNNNNEQEMGK